MIYVIDASVAVKWVVPEALSDRADRLLAGDAELIAPDLLFVEAANALRKKVARGEMTGEEASLALDCLFESPLDLRPTKDLLRRALALACRFDHPAYDCVYAALAEREGAALVTDDDRMKKVAKRMRAKVVSLSTV
jgi:predicted nucleic acid-binding protein